MRRSFITIRRASTLPLKALKLDDGKELAALWTNLINTASLLGAGLGLCMVGAIPLALILRSIDYFEESEEGVRPNPWRMCIAFSFPYWMLSGQSFVNYAKQESETWRASLPTVVELNKVGIPIFILVLCISALFHYKFKVDLYWSGIVLFVTMACNLFIKLSYQRRHRRLHVHNEFMQFSLTFFLRVCTYFAQFLLSF